MYKPLPEKISYSRIEHHILNYWEENKVFEKTLEKREGAPFFSFYEGPPTVNGSPGIHHLMARTIKDTVCRYKTMCGYYVRRQAGWDTHGLPVELVVEQNLNLKSKADVEKFGIDRFNAECKKFVYQNIEKDLGWRYLTKRMGYWVDMDQAYITCSNEYIESVWWALKQFFEKGLIYKGFKVVPQSPTIETPLSSHELSLGYKDVRDPNCYLKLKVLEAKNPSFQNSYLIVWTTTPWTLFANVALAVGKDIDYVLVRNTRKFKEGELTENYILARSRISVLDGDIEVLATFPGADLIGVVYEQIFDYIKIDRNKYPNALTVLPGDFVSTEEGSGIVHLAPAFGEDDYEMSKKFNLPFLQPVTPNGHFTNELGEFAGKAIKTFTYPDHVEEGSDRAIVNALKAASKIYKVSFDYLHSYPHCWRTGNPIMYYARDSWFIKSPLYKEEMKKLNKEINWQPPEIGIGRFGNWLEEAKEWSLSRDRFWGTPLPIWVAEDNSEQFAIGSIAELMEGYYEFPDKSIKPLKEIDIEIDLHRPFVDNVIFIKNNKVFRRVKEVIDVWFDSGAMPFAQIHYPFENKELFEKIFPSDFIAEGIDQTRGWFYTLHNIATALFGKPAFKNIVVNELILDEKGQKMSKSKGNVVDPFDVMERFGADAVRWYLLVNNPPWRATLFNEKDIAQTVISDFLRSITNIYSFFALYANIDNYNAEEEPIPVEERQVIDRWIISRLHSLIKEYRENMDAYELTKANRALQNFAINELSNWYIRRNRRRFWKGEKDKDKFSAYQTLREVLIKFLALVAPTAPFIAEDLYLRLRKADDPISVHLLDLPQYEEKYIDAELEEKMAKAQTIVSITRFLREKAKIKVRQPLNKILIPVLNPKERRNIEFFKDIILEEINVKEIEFVPADTDIVRKSAKPNFKVIGKKFGKDTQLVADLIRALTGQEINQIEKNNSIILTSDEKKFEITLEDIEIVSEDIEGWLVHTEGNITVALDTHIDEKLLNEGIARELVSQIQKLRKKMGFEVTDRISLKINADEKISCAIAQEKYYICNETLAENLLFTADNSGEKIELDDNTVFVTIEKINSPN